MTTQTRPGADAIRIELLDVCTSSFFAGTDAEETLAVPVYCDTAADELRDALTEEFNGQVGFFDNVGESGTLLEVALDELLGGMDDNEKFTEFKDAPDSGIDDEGEIIYAYFGLWTVTS